MTHPGVPGACGTPDSLRALKRILPQHDTLLKKIDAHADAWEADIREKHELARMHANEYGNLRIANANAQVAKAQADNAALRQRLEEAETALGMLSIERDIAAVEADMHTTDGTNADDRSKEE